MGTPLAALAVPMPVSVTAQQTIQFWQGDYPPPEAAKIYEELHPGTFGRLISMSEQRLTAQIADTQRAQEYARNDTRRSHWLGAATYLIAVVGAVICAFLGVKFNATGAYVVATALVGIPVMAVVKSFAESVKSASGASLLNGTVPPAALPANPIAPTLPKND